MSTPSIASKLVPGLNLLTAGTPNGHKVSIALEELGLKYTFQAISFSKSEQKSADFLAVNPNGRIPALVDIKANGKTSNVWESASILLYLTRVYDKEHKLHFEDEDLQQEMLNWMFFLHGGVGPMQGQAHHFLRYAPEKIQYGINRYQTETKRLYSVYETQLATGVDFLVGNKFSLADISAFPWIRFAEWAGVDIKEFPLTEKWIERISARSAVIKGLACPEEDTIALRKRDPVFANKKAAEASNWIMENLKKEADALAAKNAAK